ncbi:MAG TPA: adenylate/guanylate cyclase domain-containing protein [Acidimicrobiales bacterium]
MGVTLSAPEFAGVRRAILVRGATVAAPVAFFVSAYFAIWQPVFGSYPWIVQLLINVGESVGYLILILGIGNLVLRQWLKPHDRWAVDGEPITPELREALVSLPARTATWIFWVNIVAVVFGAAGNFAAGTSTRQELAYVIGFLLTGFTFATIVYLETERALRPLYRLAFATSLPRRRTVGVLPRLVISWAVGSAVPLVFIAVIPLRPGHRKELPIVAPMLYMAIGGVLVGGVTAVLAARSVTEPINAVRTGLERVRDGELDAAVTVTSPGVLGALQAGFNDMVEAMRSRQYLEDLFGRHVGEEVARQALDSGVELGGEVRDASVLFVDLIGSSALAEQQEPTKVLAVLNALFDAVAAEVAAEAGWINKFEGDGCLCVFGAPTRLEDHRARALRAARSLAARLAASGIETGIGISSGEVVAGNVGTSRRFEYTVIGRPVNEAARLTDAAKSTAAGVLASARTVDSAGPEGVNWESQGSLVLRGLSDPVEVASPRTADTVVGRPAAGTRSS